MCLLTESILIKSHPLFNQRGVTTLNNQRTILRPWISSSHPLFSSLRGSLSLWPLTTSRLPPPPSSASVSHSSPALLPAACLISVSSDDPVSRIKGGKSQTTLNNWCSLTAYRLTSVPLFMLPITDLPFHSRCKWKISSECSICPCTLQIHFPDNPF